MAAARWEGVLLVVVPVVVRAIGGVKVCDRDMLATTLRLRDTEHLSLREIASRLVIRTDKKRGRHPSPATVMRMLREHDGHAASNEASNPSRYGVSRLPLPDHRPEIYWRVTCHLSRRR
ncbi:hypothetical protein ACFWSF_24300 [Streptomyces sp. NPDC058611]|uniref:hypothetical protein n=1 Tax=unclassified Streptomyces TaxID=2593676 RepID=UPI0036568B58